MKDVGGARAAGGIGAVRDARPAEYPALGRCLARAFETDPVMRWLFPDAAIRARRMPRFYRLVAVELGRAGAVHTVDGLLGAAIWRGPHAPARGRLSRVWAMLRFAAVLGGASRRSGEFFARLERWHPEEPHWYLGVLGTDPPRQGRGVGSQLLRPVLARCDAEGRLAWLESSKRENLPFYERHGFQVVDEVRLAGAPPVWPMRREAGPLA